MVRWTPASAILILTAVLGACGTAPPARNHDTTHPSDRCPICHMYARAKHGVVRITTSQGFGSGAIIDARGWIVTNRHVVGEAEKVEVTLFDGRRFEGRVIRKGPTVDLALVELTEAPEGLAAIPMGSTREAKSRRERISMSSDIPSGSNGRSRGESSPGSADSMILRCRVRSRSMLP